MAQNNLFNKLVSKMQVMANRISNLGNSRMAYGAFHQMASYDNFHRDARPLIFCMGQYQLANGKNYTHGFNTNYMMEADKQWLARTVYLLHRSAQAIDAKTLYNMIKMQRPSMIKSSYRIYFSNMIRNPKMVCSGIPNWLAILNKNLEPSGVLGNMVGQQRIAINSTELQERITMAQNAIPLNQARITKPFGGGTPFGGSTPFGGGI